MSVESEAKRLWEEIIHAGGKGHGPEFSTLIVYIPHEKVRTAVETVLQGAECPWTIQLVKNIWS